MNGSCIKTSPQYIKCHPWHEQPHLPWQAYVQSCSMWKACSHDSKHWMQLWRDWGKPQLASPTPERPFGTRWLSNKTCIHYMYVQPLPRSQDDDHTSNEIYHSAATAHLQDLLICYHVRQYIFACKTGMHTWQIWRHKPTQWKKLPGARLNYTEVAVDLGKSKYLNHIYLHAHLRSQDNRTVCNKMNGQQVRLLNKMLMSYPEPQKHTCRNWCAWTFAAWLDTLPRWTWTRLQQRRTYNMPCFINVAFQGGGT